jgi:hypothetical protein
MVEIISEDTLVNETFAKKTQDALYHFARVYAPRQYETELAWLVFCALVAFSVVAGLMNVRSLGLWMEIPSLAAWTPSVQELRFLELGISIGVNILLAALLALH